VKIAAFPKCYLDDLVVRQTMTLFEWIEMAGMLGVEGLEMYERFFPPDDRAFERRVIDALGAAGFAMPMMCCSPDFTNPDPDGRKRAVETEAEMIALTRRLGGPGATCRVLSGQRYPNVSRAQGVEWVVESITALLPVAREHDIRLAIENHYKDGYWQYPEFAQKADVFLEIVDAIPDLEYFGVQYDPSNAIVAGDDPIDLLRRVVGRVFTVHASDRYLAEGTTLDALRQSDGTLGYSPNLRHGVTGQGLNDYHAIFRILVAAGYDGWISIEDGMNGMGEMKDSVDFLKRMRAMYCGGER
jgi:sugar phosphate isomerase/epimerase